MIAQEVALDLFSANKALLYPDDMSYAQQFADTGHEYRRTTVGYTGLDNEVRALLADYFLNSHGIRRNLQKLEA